MEFYVLSTNATITASKQMTIIPQLTTITNGGVVQEIRDKVLEWKRVAKGSSLIAMRECLEKIVFHANLHMEVYPSKINQNEHGSSSW